MRARRYAMEAVSKLELSGILYPPCPTGFNGAMPQGALAPGQALPAGTDPAQLAAMQVRAHASSCSQHPHVQLKNPDQAA